MSDGRCRTCGSTDIRERTAWLSASTQLPPTIAIRVAVCLGCSAVELYAHAQDLPSIDRSAEWHVSSAARVPVTPPATGATIRLTPQPVDAELPLQSHRSARTHCPHCGSNRMIPNVRVRDTGRSARDDMTVEVERNSGTFFSYEPEIGRVSAWVCGVCGYTALFSSNAEGLYAAYREAKP